MNYELIIVGVVAVTAAWDAQRRFFKLEQAKVPTIDRLQQLERKMSNFETTIKVALVEHEKAVQGQIAAVMEHEALSNSFQGLSLKR